MQPRRFVVSLALFSFVVFATCRAQTVQANTLNLALHVVALPTTVVLCRDPTAAGQFGVDETWIAYVDVDNNLNTGQPGNGADAIVVAQTTQQSDPV